jgi:3-dehydroquinate synthase
LAEVIKYGLINDRAFFDWLEEHAEALLAREPSALSFAIARSCQNKAQIVAEDERESGRRALLNLGHTFGHAIETGMNYEGCLHGEAVAIGICLAAKLSARLNLLAEKEVERIIQLITKMGLPTQIPAGLSASGLLQAMQVDKKVRDGKIYLILLNSIGNAVVTNDYVPKFLEEVLSQ